ncbi:uncharacterized protein LOC124925194 [Impatiens glandulifera]|uniref:uncharacterized protein LOC124925194 n=1 Tax=Impatiens glandulifera TaxID=253017 RepID=UPI001FB0715F|nr:uncharacterized protein LOC124925194 [Impatiens glandulifera]
MSIRHRPLKTCGSSISKITQNLYKDVKNSQGALGSMVARMDPLVALSAPVINIIESQSESALSFADDRILEIESKIETAFPSSTLAFDAVDEALHMVEILPAKLDGVFRSNFPSGITLDQFLSWVYVFLITLFKLCTSILTHGGLPEKEIMVDITYNITRRGSESSMSSSNYLSDRLGWMKCSYKDILKKPEKEAEKCSYKDILEKGTKHDHPNTRNIEEEITGKKNEDIKLREIGRIKDDQEKEYIIVKAGEREEGEDTPKDPLGGIKIKGDPTLQFDTNWHIKPSK